MPGFIFLNLYLAKLIVRTMSKSKRSFCKDIYIVSYSTNKQYMWLHSKVFWHVVYYISWHFTTVKKFLKIKKTRLFSFNKICSSKFIIISSKSFIKLNSVHFDIYIQLLQKLGTDRLAFGFFKNHRIHYSSNVLYINFVII